MPTEKQWSFIKWENAYRKSKDIAYFNCGNNHSINVCL